MPALAVMVPRKYLFPCTGYVASRRKNVINPNQLSADSRDVLISPNEGQLIRRFGMTYVTEADISAPVGLMEGFWSGGIYTRARRAFAFPSVYGPGQTGPAALVGASPPEAAYGSLFVYDAPLGTKYQFGKEFGSTHYPTSSNAGGCNFKMVPVPYVTPDSPNYSTPILSSSVGITRCAHAFARRFIGPGSRGVYCGDHTYLPSLYGTPMDWNNRFNPTTSTGTEINRAKPWGLYQPLFAPSAGAATAAAGTADANWQDGDTYYLSVMFQMEDGSFSKPFANRPPSAGVSAANAGLITVGTPGGLNSYQSVPYTNIAIGPQGTRARLLLRTRKVRRTTATDSPILPDPSQLFILAVIENNTQTSYTDFSGDDGGLRKDDLAVRFDGIWPPAARNVFEFERRLGVGFARKNPCAIMLAPTGSVASRDLNVPDTAAAAYGVNAFCYRIVQIDASQPDFQWRKIVIATGVITTGTKALGSSISLQDLVDYINQQANLGSGSEWAAQLVPGVDGNISSLKIQPTSLSLSNCKTTNLSNLVEDPSATGRFADVAVGTRIVGTNIPANSIIISKDNNNGMRIGNQSGAAVNATGSSSVVTFVLSQNTGDDGLFTVGAGDSTTGNVRAYCPAFPAIVAFRGSYLDTLPIDKRAVYFTAAPPGQAASAHSSFFNSLSNRQSVPTKAGSFLAGAPIGKRAVLAYTGGIYVLDNQRGGTTAEDFDFHPYVGNAERGCISINSLVAGNGWVGYLTRDGYIVADIVGDILRERLLSGDIYDPAQSTAAQRGLLDVPISTGVRYPDPDGTAFADSDSGFYAALVGGALNLLYNPVFGGTQRIVYDFRASIEASGLDQVLRSVGVRELGAQAYGWSAPLSQPLMAIVGGVHANLTFGFVDYNTLVSIPDPSTGDLTMVYLDAGGNIGRDDIYQRTVSSNFAISSTQLTAAFAGGYRSVAVGARVTGHANIQALTTVVNKSADGNTLTLSLPTTNGGVLTGQSVTFTGQEVEPIAYFAMDQVESLRQKKVGHRGTTLHRCQTGEQLYLGFARDRTRQSRRTMLLQATAGDNTRQVVEVPMVARAPGEVVEFSIEGHNASLGQSVSNGGYPAEFWGLEAEIELLDSHV